MALAGGLLLNEAVKAAPAKKKVIVWSEGTAPKNVYPNDINTAIAEGLKPLKGWDVATANISDPDQGLPDDVLNSATVLIWWGHQKHGDVKDELVQKIVKRVKEDGMGFIATHSAHYSKPLKAVLGTNCGWKYYTDDGAKLDVVCDRAEAPDCQRHQGFCCPQD